MAKIFIDTNIVLDLLLKREPFVRESQLVLDLAIADDRVQLQFSECSIPIIAYTMLKKINDGEEQLVEFLELCDLLSAPKKTYIQALTSGFKDKEDAMQYYIALYNNCDYFITRNVKDYKPYQISSLPVLSPGDFHKNISPSDVI